nr:putative uncharacterized hydrolase [Quercus suber]
MRPQSPLNSPPRLVHYAGSASGDHSARRIKHPGSRNRDSRLCARGGRYGQQNPGSVPRADYRHLQRVKRANFETKRIKHTKNMIRQARMEVGPAPILRFAPPPVRACLFDMDGLLIDSEDLITTCINEILSEYHKPPLSWSIKAQLQGRTLREASKIVLLHTNLPLSEDEYQQKLRQLHQKWFPMARPLPGVVQLLETLSAASEVEIALATSSNSEKFQLKTGHLSDLFSVFPARRRVLGDDARIPPGRHKPAPDIYLLALECVNEDLRREGRREITPEECLVLEDSIQGVEAGRRAGMQVVWCPHPGLLAEVKGQEERVLRGHLGEETERQDHERAAECHDNRWATLLPSLENFDYQMYGIIK